MVLHNFIVFEGLDGSGTTTQLGILKNKLEQKKAWFTAEPTGKETGLFLRNILSGGIKLDHRTLAFLFAADRCEHLYGKDGILQHLNNGEAVFCDRYIFSSLAYQSPECGNQLPEKLNEDFPLPEYLVYFDIPSELSLSRVSSRKGHKEIFEEPEIQKNTRTEYERILQLFSERKNTGMKTIRIDASKSIDEVHKNICISLQNLPIFKE